MGCSPSVGARGAAGFSSAAAVPGGGGPTADAGKRKGKKAGKGDGAAGAPQRKAATGGGGRADGGKEPTAGKEPKPRQRPKQARRKKKVRASVNIPAEGGDGDGSGGGGDAAPAGLASPRGMASPRGAATRTSWAVYHSPEELRLASQVAWLAARRADFGELFFTALLDDKPEVAFLLPRRMLMQKPPYHREGQAIGRELCELVNLAGAPATLARRANAVAHDHIHRGVDDTHWRSAGVALSRVIKYVSGGNADVRCAWGAVWATVEGCLVDGHRRGVEMYAAHARLNSAQRRLILESWRAVERGGAVASFTDGFYRSLFDRDPAIRALFADPAEQPPRLASMMDLMVRGIADVEALYPTLNGLARRHIRYGVRAEHYPPFRDALLDALAGAGGEGFRAEHRDAWGAYWAVLQDALLSEHAAEDEAPDEAPFRLAYDFWAAIDPARAAAAFRAAALRYAPQLLPQLLAHIQASDQVPLFAKIIGAILSASSALDPSEGGADRARVLRELGRRHPGWGARPEHFAVLRDALLDALAECGGKKFTAAHRNEWAALYDLAHAAMTISLPSHPSLSEMGERDTQPAQSQVLWDGPPLRAERAAAVVVTSVSTEVEDEAADDSRAGGPTRAAGPD